MSITELSGISQMINEGLHSQFLLGDENTLRLKSTAWDRFVAQLPNLRRAELWKYAPVNSFNFHQLPCYPRSIEEKPSLESTQLDARVVFVDGVFSPELSTGLNSIEGVSVVCLSALNPGQQQYYSEQLEQLQNSNNALNHLNIALCCGGVLLTIDSSIEPGSTLELLHIVTESAGTIQRHVHNVIQVKANANLTLIERVRSEGLCEGVLNTVSQLSIEPNATVHHCKVHEADSQLSLRFGYTLATLGRDSRYHGAYLAAGQGYVREQFVWNSESKHVVCQWNGLQLVAKGSQIECYTTAQHSASQCQSNQIIRSVLANGANATCHNGIVVAKQASGTDAQLQNRNLLLGKKARVNTKPELEIYNDDVSCSHGATVGYLDQQALFYLQSRGLPEAKARDLLLKAFVDDVFAGIESDTISSLLSGEVSTALLQLDSSEVEDAHA